MNKIFLVSATALLAGAALAANINHPNLRDAFGAADGAIHHVEEAQANNKGVEFGGHAGKAIELLRQAQHEIVEADQWNDAHHH